MVDPTRTPAWRLTLGGRPLNQPQGRLISLTLRDNRGFEADQIDLVLSDHDGKLSLPEKGVVIALSLGWRTDTGEQLVDKGTYTVDEIAYDTEPDKITVRARSADFRDKLTENHSQSWHQVTLGDIVTTIAERHGLTPAIGGTLASIAIPHVDQTDESDVHFLTRLAKQYGAIATQKAGRLLFVRAAMGMSARGQGLKRLFITRADGDRISYRDSDRTGRITGVKANWLDKQKAKAEEVLAGEEGKTKTLRKVYPSHDEAWRAAEAELKRISRAGKSLSLTLSEGRPEVIPESPVTVSGWKPEIDGTEWVVAQVTHTLAGNGLLSSIELEPLDSDSEG